ncbi:uncharacterized protein LOC143265480 isoform X2 [Megachile rotundata]|uniref:uncharacterized protein LOC143265480 isoform X2 n=1 Tax=Megachile rotundata TaxID=143995 RepID=UPI003FD1AA07
MCALRVRLPHICVLIILCSFDLSIARPAEQPTKFTLNTGNTIRTFDSRVSSTLEQIHVGTSKSHTTEPKTESTMLQERSLEVQPSSVTLDSHPPPVTNTRPNARETVRLENESAQSFFEKPVPRPAAGLLESFLKPTPIVDGIKEQDKYGNTGDKFIGIGRALVNSFEGFSNFLNAIVDFPRNAAKTTSRGLTEALNHVGAKLVGLE